MKRVFRRVKPFSSIYLRRGRAACPFVALFFFFPFPPAFFVRSFGSVAMDARTDLDQAKTTMVYRLPSPPPPPLLVIDNRTVSSCLEGLGPDRRCWFDHPLGHH